MPSAPPGRSWVYGPCRGYESLFLGVNFVNFPDVWNLRFCKVRRVNLGQVSGGVASLSVAPIEQADCSRTIHNSGISTQQARYYVRLLSVAPRAEQDTRSRILIQRHNM